MVCDKCVGVLYQLADEIQLKHEDECPNKWREDTFLLSMAVDAHLAWNVRPYPRNGKLNPEIHQRLWDGEITQEQAQYENESMMVNGDLPS